MMIVPLSILPNQSLSIRLDDNVYDITVKTARDITAVDIMRNGVVLVQGMRATPGTPLLPYKRLQDGNFAFVTPKGEYPFYTQFGVTHFLYYASQTEIDAIRNG